MIAVAHVYFSPTFCLVMKAFKNAENIKWNTKPQS